MALLQCKEEIKTYLGALEESRDKYDRDIRHKEEMVIMFSLLKAACRCILKKYVADVD